MPERYLLNVAIGPVQEFIAAGRKTRDLWFGSTLLSNIALALATELKENGNLIFPDPDSVRDQRAAPNKLLVLLREGVDPQEVAQNLRTKAADVLRGYWTTWVSDPHGKKGLIDHDLAEEQIASFLEFYASWEPVPDAAGGYQIARERTEQLLSGRKALRDFTQPGKTTQGRRKSELDPLRESVITLTRVPQGATWPFAMLHLKPGEHLDAVSLVKRLAQIDSTKPRFVSTARVAIDPFIGRIASDPNMASKLQDLIEKARNGSHDIGAEEFDASDAGTPKLGHYAPFPYDIQLFYDSGAASPEITKPNKAAAKEFFATAQDLRRVLRIPELPAYYAIVVADGDHMGKLIDRLADWQHHQALSRHLSQFSTEVANHAAAHSGALVYAGGDDVLAFLPVDQAVPFASAIRGAFEAVIADFHHEIGMPPDLVEPTTLTAGIAIVHYAESLSRALDWARQTEAYAKNAPVVDDEHPGFTGRNALAIAWYPRGAEGPSSRAGHNWENEGARTVDRWARWVAYHRYDLFPDGAGYEIRRLAHESRGQDTAIRQVLEREELKRILEKKRSGHGSTRLAGLVQQSIVDAAGNAIGRVASEIIIAREIASAVNVAQGRPVGIPPDLNESFIFPARKQVLNA